MSGERADVVATLDRQYVRDLERRERVLRDELRSAWAEVHRLHAEVAQLRAELDRGPR